MTKWNLVEREIHQSGSWPIVPRGTRRSRQIVVLVALAAVSLAGCGTAISNLITLDEAFIVKGTAEMKTAFAVGPCLAWVDTSGAVYQLFQGTNVSNAEFDLVTTPGVTSRLQLTVRSDLIVGCSVGTTAVVDAVLEVIQ
jgi:hypothetical protein